jgi:hypothetical protein
MVKKRGAGCGLEPHRNFGRCGHIVVRTVPMFGFESGKEGVPYTQALVPDESRDSNGMCVSGW